MQPLDALQGEKVQEKSIHIVFQILNLLSDPSVRCHYPKLTPDEKLLLLFLAKHKGHKGIYPSILTLAKELDRSDSAIQRSAKRLVQKGFIRIDPVPGKSNNYTILILGDTPSVDATPSVELPLASTLPHPPRPRYPTPSVDATQSDKSNNRFNNTERARKGRLPLSLSWKPSEKALAQATGVGTKVNKSADELITKFRNLQASKQATSANWNAEFENFLINERPTGFMGSQSVTQVTRPTGIDYTAARLEREAKTGTSEFEKKKAQSAVEVRVPTPREVIEMLRKQKQGELNGERGAIRDTNER